MQGNIKLNGTNPTITLNGDGSSYYPTINFVALGGTYTTNIFGYANNIYSDADSHVFRTRAGTTKMTIDSGGNVYANAYYYNSDAGLKLDIKPAPGLATILALQGVNFRWQDSGEKDMGLIAQEVEKIAPELVAVNPATGLKSVKYSGLIAPLIEAVKELHAENERQNARIKQLENQLNGGR